MVIFIGQDFFISEDFCILYLANKNCVGNHINFINYGCLYICQGVIKNNRCSSKANLVIDILEFIDPLDPNFEQAGNISQPAGEDNWNLVWDEEGSPAMNKTLIFDENDFISKCISGYREIKCSDANPEEFFGVNDVVIAQGMINPDNGDEIHIMYISEP